MKSWEGGILSIHMLSIWSQYVTVRNTCCRFKKLYFFHTVYLCFIWFAELIWIIYLKKINRLVFKTESECVICEVGTEFYVQFR
jgi:hypothetical protein